jgi:hypothetical protein
VNAVGPETSAFLQIRLFSAYKTELPEIVLRKFRGKQALTTLYFSSVTPTDSKQPSNDAVSISQTSATEIATVPNASFER